MKKLKTPVIAGVVLIVSVLFIANYRSFHFFLPAQQVELSHGVEYGAVVKGFLFVQEITMQKRYISRADLYMAKLPSQYPNENVFLLLDEQHRVLYTKKFSSDEFGEALYFPFDFGKQLDIGRGKTIYACIYSLDGDQGSYIGLAKKENSHLGKLYVVTILNNDIIQSFEKQQSLVNFKGSIGVRTYESDTRYFSLLQVVFYILAALLALLILFINSVRSFIQNSRIVPENAFLGFSLAFGLLLLVITPPFMIPDEQSHFYRAYQVSELNIFKFRDEVPKSLVDLAARCERMRFSTHEKTTRNEILSMRDIKLDPGTRIAVETQNYTVPYVPQALGIFAGRVLHLNPLWLMYLGRIFNLLVSVLLVFLAIRTTPVLKWLFFLLGIMPMTLYQFASLSYDALTISLSLFLISVFLDFALNEEKKSGKRKLLVLFIFSALLAAVKPPYYIIVFSFLIIPRVKIGSLKRYALIFGALVLMVAVISQLWSPGRKIFGQMTGVNDRPPKTGYVAFPEESLPPKILAVHNPLLAMLPMMPHSNAELPSPADKPDSSARTSQQNQQSPQQGAGNQGKVEQGNPYDPPAQKQFILDDPARYTGIMFSTLLKSAGLYAVSFVGLFGWVDAPLPGLLAYAYIFVLLLITIGIPFTGQGIGFLKRCYLFALFAISFVLIETAMYLYCNPVGNNTIIAVQGRYFIALAPLLFILFLNNSFIGIVQKIFSSQSKKPAGKLPKQKKQAAPDPVEKRFLTKALQWLAMVAAFVTLSYSLLVIIERFYVISM